MFKAEEGLFWWLYKYLLKLVRNVNLVKDIKGKRRISSVSAAGARAFRAKAVVGNEDTFKVSFHDYCPA